MNTAAAWRPAPHPEATSGGVLAHLGRAAVAALYDELALYPKPGLVSFVDTGSHSDMDAQTFMRSLFALRHYFTHMAWLGAQGADFAALERCGIAAEARMLRATGGINTHRGAVFTLGLLCAAGGAVRSTAAALQPAAIQQALQACWGPALAVRAQRAPRLPGGLAAQRHGLRGAAQEAAEGFPVLFGVAWPALHSARSRGLDTSACRIDALMHTLAVLDDSNLAHRGGMAGLHFARQAARDFVAGGGMAQPDGLAQVQALHRAFVARRLSPGGSADMLAAACWLQRVDAAG